MSGPALRVGVLPGASEALLERLERAGVEPEPLIPDAPPPSGLECLLVEPPTDQAIAEARRARAHDESLQLIVVLSTGWEREQAERRLVFASGLGEVWVVEMNELDAELFRRAADIAAQRRGYRHLRRRLTGQLAGIRTHQHERTRISDAYLAALLQVLRDAVLSIDDDGAVLSWNPASEVLLGVTGAEIAGRPIDELIAPAEPEGWRRALDAGSTTTTQLTVEYGEPGAEPRVAEVTITPVVPEGRRVRVVVLHDVTEQRRARSELERQTVELEAQASQLQEQATELEMMNVELQDHGEALEEALASRSRFYAAMSHELRTPMNAIIGYNALLVEGVYGELSDDQRDAIERAQRAAMHLLELVNDVLDLAKIEAGRIDLEPQRTDIQALLEELADTVRHLADEHGSDLVVDTGDGPYSIHTDPRRVRQILLNLLSNALKFGCRRPVRLFWEPLNEGGAIIHVADQGVGIDPEDQRRIFEEFVQVGEDGTGTGLGLSISKRLAEVLSGELSVVSEVGRGSDFRLRLPRALPDEDRVGTVSG